MPNEISRESWLALTTRLLTSEGLHSMGVPVSWGLTQLQGLAEKYEVPLEDFVQDVLKMFGNVLGMSQKCFSDILEAS